MVRSIFFGIWILGAQMVSADSGEMYFQPEAQQQVIHPSYTFGRIDVKTANGRGHMTDHRIVGRYLYGVSDIISIGGQLQYARSKNDFGQEYSYSGLGDIAFNLRGRSVSENGVLRFGVDFSVSPEPSKDNSSGQTDNQYTGRNKITPYLGYEFILSSTGRLGFSLSQDFLLGKDVSEDSSGTKTKTTGSNLTTLMAYYEHLQSPNDVLGVSLDYSDRSDTKDSDGEVESEGISMLSLGLYGRYQVSENGYLVPKFKYSETLSDTINSIKIKNWSVVSLEVGLRFLF